MHYGRRVGLKGSDPGKYICLSQAFTFEYLKVLEFWRLILQV